MKRIFVSISVLSILLVFFSSCLTLTKKTREWTFIEEVGGVKIKEPFLTADGWYLPVVCDVSGTSVVTKYPTTVNSALECADIKYEIVDSIIYISIQTAVVGTKSYDCKCRPFRIGRLRLNKYEVYYKDKNEVHYLGRFNVNEILNKY